MGKYYNKNNEYKIKKIKLNNNSSLGYSNFYSVDGEESSLELVFKLNILRQQYIKNKNLFELLSELSIWLKDKQKLKLLILSDQEFKNLIILNSFKYDKNFDHLQKFRDENIEQWIDNKFFNKKIKNSTNYINKLLSKIDGITNNNLIYEIYEEDFKSRNKINLIEYIIWCVRDVININKELDTHIYYLNNINNECLKDNDNNFLNFFKDIKFKKLLIDPFKHSMGYFNNKKVTNIYFKSKEPLYKELNYTYLIFLLDNWEKLIKFYNKKNIIRLGNNINNLLVNPQIQKLWYNRWSKILLNNWGYNFKPLNKENLEKYNENGYISKFDNRLMYIPDLFNLTSTEYEIYKDSFLVNIEYKNYKESDALFRFYLNKNYKIFWEKLKELGIKNKKLTLKNLTKNNLLNYLNNSQILIYTDFNKTNKDMVYQYLLLNLWYIYMNIDILKKDRELIKNELLKEGLNKNLLIESGNIIYVINNIRKFCLYKYEFNKDCKLKGITIEGKNYINSLEKKLNIVNNKLLNIFNVKKNNILNQISKLINYDKNNFKINIGDLNTDSWKNKFSLLKYNRENNYNRIIIDKLFYNPIFLGNLHILNPYKYDKNRNVNYDNFDYNIYQNPEEQIDYTNIIEIGNINTQIKGSTIYVINELNLYSDLIYAHKPFWILNWVNGSGKDDDEVFDEYSDFPNKKLLEDDYFSFFKEFPLKYQYISSLEFILEKGSNIGINLDITTYNLYKGNPYLK